MHDPRISALLRLKRFEQPPPGYFDRLLGQVHRRQREELLHRPLWKIAFERTQVFFSEHSMGGLSYAGAMAVLLAVGIGIIGVVTPGEAPNRTASGTAAKLPAEPTRRLDPGVSNRMLLSSPQGGARLVGQLHENSPSEVSPPRYVIDARPVSYEPADRF